MQLRKVPEAPHLLDIALRRGRKESSSMGKQRNRLKQEKQVEIRRIEVSANYVRNLLMKIVDDFPSLKESSPFFREMVEATVDADAVKKALGQFSALSKIVRKLKSTHIIKIKRLGKGRDGESKRISREFIGRLASTLKSAGKSIRVYNKAAEKLRELPAIKEDLPTVIIAGYPNVGKSTLLRKITGSNVKIAAYAFTTKKLELGYFKEGYLKYQIIDTPGLLDRPLGEMNRIELKGIAALRHLANVVVFVVDPTEECGFPLEKQAGLLKGMEKEFGKGKIVVFLSKSDISEKKQEERAKKIAGGFPIIQGKAAVLREEIAKRAR